MPRAQQAGDASRCGRERVAEIEGRAEGLKMRTVLEKLGNPRGRCVAYPKGVPNDAVCGCDLELARALTPSPDLADVLTFRRVDVDRAISGNTCVEVARFISDQPRRRGKRIVLRSIGAAKSEDLLTGPERKLLPAPRRQRCEQAERHQGATTEQFHAPREINAQAAQRCVGETIERESRRSILGSLIQ